MKYYRKPPIYYVKIFITIILFNSPSHHIIIQIVHFESCTTPFFKSGNEPKTTLELERAIDMW
jgi:hypothetical protein